MDIAELEAAVSDPNSAQFLRAWLGWRGARLAPRRGDMVLRDIAPLLGSVALFEPRGADEILIRLAGTSLRELVDFELTGRNFRDITAPADWPLRRRRLATMSARPCGGFMHYRDVQPSGRTVMFEAVTLPLEAELPGKPHLLISCSSLLNRSFQDPRRVQPRSIPLADDFAFVDVGAGTTPVD